MRARSRAGRKGFTIVELMVVVVIVGILAAIAVPAYRKYISRARTQEAMTVLPSIRALQLTYYAEFRQYVTAPANPTAAPCGEKGKWNASVGQWQQLGIRPGNAVSYHYWVDSSGASTTTSPDQATNSCDKEAAAASSVLPVAVHYPTVGPWFIACARGNPKGAQCGDKAHDHIFAITGSKFSFRVMTKNVD